MSWRSSEFLPLSSRLLQFGTFSESASISTIVCAVNFALKVPMRIASLTAHNIKCPSFSHDIGAVTVLVGDNASGKSARLEAIRLGLLGFVPGLPKTNAGIFSLSCGSTMSVSLRLTDGTIIERTYTQKGDSIKATDKIEGKGWLEVPPVLMDSSEYLRLSERERVKFVFGLVQLDDHWSGERILQLVGETPIDCDKEIVEAVVLSKKAVLDSLLASDMERYDNGGSVQEWLEVQVNELRERVKTTNAGLQRMEKFSQAIVELKQNGTSAENVDRLLRDKRQALQEASIALAVAKASQETARRNEATRKELVHRLSDHPFDAKAIESTRKQISDLEAAQTERVDLGNLAFKVAEARGQLEAAKQMLKITMTDLEILEQQRERDLKEPKCPHCGTAGKKFQSAMKKRYETHLKELMAAKTKTQSEIATAQAAYGAVQGAYEIAAIADKKAERDRLLLQSLKAEVLRLETLTCNRAAWQTQLDGLTAAQAPTDAALFELQKQVSLLATEAGDLDARQKRWVAQAHEAKRTAEAKAQRQALEAELVALKAVVKSVESIQAKLVSESFSMILADVNRLTSDILLSPVDYHNGEIGRWGASHVWIPHRSWSGTEQLIGCAGISVALSRQSPIKIILLDEMGRLSVGNKKKLTSRLIELTTEGFIDQCLLVDVTPEPYTEREGVNVISV